jgi:WH2 motif
MASSELLKQIQAGTKLKRAVEINDRSSPQIDAGASSLNKSSSPQLAGLFAGGMPKLKPASQSKFAVPPTIGKSSSISNRSPVSTNLVPRAQVSARLRLPSCGDDMGSPAPIPPRQTSPAIRSKSPTTQFLLGSLISR